MNTETNYWHDTLCTEERALPGVLVILGSSGDLAKRKLYGALYRMYQNNLIPKDSKIIGCTSHKMLRSEFRKLVKDCVEPVDSKVAVGFLSKFEVFNLDYNDLEAYRSFKRFLRRKGFLKSKMHLTYYLATPYFLLDVIVPKLHKAGLLTERNNIGWRHVVIEKPFGFSFDSAKNLDLMLHKYLKESQIYRIDHYLGKDTVQNIFMLRFANLIFEELWSNRYIEQIQITVFEEIGIEKRGGYFEKAGILRDMFQNHLLEILAITAMEMPLRFDADSVRDEKLKLINSIRGFDAKNLERQIIRAQYTSSEKIAGYREEAQVAPDSTVETFVAAKLMIDNWRWHGVPFYLRTGKRMAKKESKITIVFRKVPHSIFAPLTAEDLEANILTLHIQPEEGVTLSIQAKKPGPRLCMGSMDLKFNYSLLGSGKIPLDAYARLIHDCQLGDQTLYLRSDVIAASWRLFEPVLDTWNKKMSPLYFYPAMSSSVPESETLMESGHRWLD